MKTPNYLLQRAGRSMRASVLTCLLLALYRIISKNGGESGRTSNCLELCSREEIADFSERGELPPAVRSEGSADS